MLVVIKCLGYGGAERLLVDLMASRDAGSFDYEVAYVLAAENALVPAVRAEGVPVHDLGATHNWDLRWMPRFATLLRRGHFDVVHFHLPYAAAMGRLVVATLPGDRRPVVVYTEHSLWEKTAAPVRVLNRLGVNRDQALVAVSPAAHDALPEALRPRAEVVVHGVHLSRSDEMLGVRREVRAEVRAELGVGCDQLLVLTVANLRVEKGYDVLLDAARLVADRGVPIHFAAVGRGPLRDELHARQKTLGLEANFTFLGQRSDVLRLLAASDVFVLASRHEGLPVALMEATSMGLPIVATRVGGVPGVLTDELDALLVPPGQPDSLAQAIERLAGDPGLGQRLGRAAKARSAMFDITVTSRRMEDIYREVVEDAHAGDDADKGPLVLHVIPTPAGRGAQREARALADQLDQPGVRRHRVLSLFDGDEEVRADFSLRFPGRSGPAAGFDPRLVWRLRTALAAHDPAVVVAHGSDPLKFLVPAMVGRRRPLVYYVIGTYAGSPDRRLQLGLWRWLSSRADVVAACGDDVRQECVDLLALPPDMVALVVNGRDPERFAPRPPGPPAAEPLVVFVGALAPTKRPARFIEVVAALRAQGQPLRAQVVGEGPLGSDLVPAAAAAKVDLLGRRPDVPELLRQADLLVFPSEAAGEGMPGVLIEAGLSGLPVVATAVPGVSTIVEEGRPGVVGDVDDFGALVSATGRLLADTQLRAEMGRAARARCLDRFSMAAAARRWSAVLDPLLTRRP